MKRMSWWKIAIGCLVFLLLLGIFFWDYWGNINQIASDDKKIHLEEITQQATGIIRAKLEDSLALVRGAAGAASFFDRLEDPRLLSLLEQYAEVSDFRSVSAVLPNGDVLTGEEDKRSVKGEVTFQQAMQGKAVISQLLVDSNGSRYLMVSAPVEQNGRITGCIIGVYGEEDLQRILDIQTFAGEGACYLIDPDGIWLTVSRPETGTGNRSGNSFFDAITMGDGCGQETLERDLQEKHQAFFSYFDHQVPYYASYVDLGIGGWRVMSAVPTSVATDHSGKIMAATAILGGKIVLLLAAAGVFIFIDRGKSHKAVFSATQNLNRIASNIPGGVCKCSAGPERMLEFINKGFAKLFGYEKNELMKKIGGNYELLIDPADWGRVKQDFAEQLQRGKKVETEYRAVTKSGETIWILERSELVPDPDKQRLYCVMVDVTDLKKAEQRLRLSEQRYQIALEKSDYVIFEYDISSRQLHHGKKAMELYGLPAVEEPVPEVFQRNKVVHPEDLERYTRLYAEVQDGCRAEKCVVRMRCANGEFIWNKVTLTPLYEDGKAVRAVGIMENITAEKEAQERLMREQKYRESLKCLYTVHFEVNLTRDYFHMGGETCCDILDLPENGVFSQAVQAIEQTLLFPEDRERYWNIFSVKPLLESYRNGDTEFDEEFRCRGVQGQGDSWWLSHCHLYQEPQGDICALIFLKNIDDEKKQVLLLQAKAERDSLTGLYNKGTTENMISQILYNGETKTSIHGLLILDMDNFKSVNDTLGHHAGDTLLLDIAANLRSVCRKTDIIGRIGGDEFIIFLQDMKSPETAVRKAEEILKGFREHFWSVPTQDISASIGIAVSPDHGATFCELYQNADQALYESKHKGKNTYSVYCRHREEPGI